MLPIPDSVFEVAMSSLLVCEMNSSPQKRQGGVAMIETLVAILIFSFGILGIIGLQATSIQQVSEAKYRIDAANLADQLLGEIWSDDHTTSIIAAKYATGGGTATTGYLAWRTQVQNALPGAITNPPTVTVVADAVDALRSTVTVTVRWQSPGAASVSNYVSSSRIR